MLIQNPQKQYPEISENTWISESAEFKEGVVEINMDLVKDYGKLAGEL